MGRIRKSKLSVRQVQQQKQTGIVKSKPKPVVSEKKPSTPKKGGKKTKPQTAPRKPIVFVSPKVDKSIEDGNADEDMPAEDTRTEKPSVLEPVPTDVPDPQLPPRLQKLISPLIAYVYNNDQMSLRLSFEQAAILLEKEYDAKTKVFRFMINTMEICRAEGDEAEAHREARDKLIQVIRYYCYTVKRVKDFHTRRKIFHARPPNPPKNQKSADSIKEENIGFKMLQKQGWSGGALGTNEDGIIEPIVATQRKGKSGLGTENATKDAVDGGKPGTVKIPLEAFYMIMKQYAGVNALYDLVFSTQFTKPQLAKLKSYATSLKLLPQMIGKKKRLVVSRPLTIKQIKAGVMRGHSDLCAKYVVIPPAAGIPEEDKTVLVKPRKEPGKKKAE